MDKFPHRTSLEITRDILKVISKGAHLRGQIIQKANLRAIELIARLDALKSKGLIDETLKKGHHYYELTPEGKVALKTMTDLFEGRI